MTQGTANGAVAKRRTQGLDEFLSYNPRTGGGAYLSGWKEDGRIVVYLHTELWSAPFWNHGIPHLVEDKETKGLVVRSQRWGCHDPEAVLTRQYFLDKKTKLREAPPVLCPSCMTVEAVRAAIVRGAIPWTDPVFEWAPEEGEERTIITAGGLTGLYKAKDLSPAQLREMRAAGIRRDEAYREDLRARLQFLFCVVDADNPGGGIQKTFESKALGDHMKRAVRDEIRRAGGDGGNPTINPYPFEWSFDKNQSFDEMYAVLAMTMDTPKGGGTPRPHVAPEEVLSLIRGPEPDVDRDLAPGNCYWLRNQLESHYVGPKDAINWDAVFAAADKAGLMVPPEESKADAAEDVGDPEPPARPAGRTPEVRGAAGEPAARRRGATIEVGPDHAAWKTKGWKAPDTFAFAEVYLTAPDDASDELVDAIRKACRAAGVASVAERVLCEHCDGAMTTIDVACPVCGAQYDDNGKLTTRPCLVDGCQGGQVPLSAEGERTICEKCGAIHEMVYEDGGVGPGTWTLVEEPPPAPQEQVPSRRRRSAGAAAVAAPAEPPAPTQGEPPAGKRDVPFDQPRGGAPTTRATSGKAAPARSATPARSSARR